MTLAVLSVACSRPAADAPSEPRTLGSRSTAGDVAPAESRVSPIAEARGDDEARGADEPRAEDHGSSGPIEPVDVPDDMAQVPAGTFRMGADDEGEMDERPAHDVSITSFLLDLTEVTNAAYRRCVDAGVCKAPHSLEGSPLVHGMAHVFRRDDHPVAGVSWHDAQTYCAWKGRRLPSEAEWERTARADDRRRYVWGDERPDPKRHGVFGGQATTAPVGSKPDGRSVYGHLDLAGNVWEWVADDYDPFAYTRATASMGVPGTCERILEAQDQLRREGKHGFTGSNPIPTECEKVLRGGAYNYRADGLRNSNRVHHPARFRIAVAGFRCARDLYPPTNEVAPQ